MKKEDLVTRFWFWVKLNLQPNFHLLIKFNGRVSLKECFLLQALLGRNHIGLRRNLLGKCSCLKCSSFEYFLLELEVLLKIHAPSGTEVIQITSNHFEPLSNQLETFQKRIFKNLKIRLFNAIARISC